MTQEEVYKKANKVYPLVGSDPPISERNAYVRGYLDALNEMSSMPEDFFTQIAVGLKKLWPSGNKEIRNRDGSVSSYAWQDSVTNLVKRLAFLWKERQYKDKYTVDDCMSAARRYLAQFQDNARYMQTLRYFVFRQDKLNSTNGKATYVCKSSLADYLETAPVMDMSSELETFFDSSTTFDQGNLI